MRLYLGGKMMGVVGGGFPAFDSAAKALRALGHDVFNPAERDRESGFQPATDVILTQAELDDKKFDRRGALSVDLTWILLFSEGMVCLRGWETSPGTKAEIAVHQGLYLPVWELDDFLRVGYTAPKLNPLVDDGKDWAWV